MGADYKRDTDSIQHEVAWQTNVDMFNRDMTTGLLWGVGLIIGWVFVAVFGLLGLVFRKATTPAPRTDHAAMVSRPRSTSDEDQRRAIEFFRHD